MLRRSYWKSPSCSEEDRLDEFVTTSASIAAQNDANLIEHEDKVYRLYATYTTTTIFRLIHGSFLLSSGEAKPHPRASAWSRIAPSDIQPLIFAYWFTFHALPSIQM